MIDEGTHAARVIVLFEVVVHDIIDFFIFDHSSYLKYLKLYILYIKFI
jgi:hypothetical protein